MTPKTRPYAAALVCCLAQACGTEIGNPKKPKDDPKNVFLVADASVVNDLIASQTDEVLATTAEDLKALTGLKLNTDEQRPGSDGGTPHLPGSGAVPPAAPTSTSSCTPDASGGLAVAVTVIGNETRAEDRGGYLSNFVAYRDEMANVTWKQPGTQLVCNADGTDKKIDWTSAEGLTIDASVHQKRSTAITRQGPRGTFTRQSDYELIGQRHSVFAMDPAHAPADGILLKKTVTSVVDKTIVTTQKRTNLPVTIFSHIEVRADAPVIVAIVREPDGSTWRSKTITGGTVVNTQAEGSRVESTYSDLMFTADAGCAPVSGSVIGAIYGTEAAPLSTFKISFDDGEGTITYQDGSTAPYVADYCGTDDAPKP